MSCFRIPQTICAKIEGACANFWWGMEGGRKKIHWLKWTELCRPKNMGGMGFRNLVEFNKALLAKQIWRIIRNPNSLVARVLKARYFRHGDIMEASIGTKPSYIWRSLLWSRDLIKQGASWRIGNGEQTRIFRDHWVPSLNNSLRYTSGGLAEDDRVEKLIGDGAWDEQMIRGNFLPYVADAIMSLPEPKEDREDCCFWRFDTKAIFGDRGTSS
ncbi:hypothetical protein DH2020_004743 [Rehmannia glutinosa]|uniref:Uncharacterized protein n=1 Tax=Rehmannia glutinosa TaxID=99300 RepID=A0ABR0XQD1_REHGL